MRTRADGDRRALSSGSGLAARSRAGRFAISLSPVARPWRARCAGRLLRLGLGLTLGLVAPAAWAADTPAWQINWVIDLKLPVLVSLIIFLTLVFVMIRAAKANPHLYIRPLAGITAIEEAVGRATEMGRPVIYIPGVDDIN